MRHLFNSMQRARSSLAVVSFCGLTLLDPQGSSAQARTPLELTLEQALQQAFQASPVLRARQAQVRQAEARLVGARTYPFNPEIELTTAERQGPVESSTDRAVLISQEIEIGGQRGKRTATAAAELEAERSAFEREQRELAARVRLTFAATLRARELLLVAETESELTSQLLDFARRRLEAGAGTQIELNLARSTAGQAERTQRLAQAAEVAARGRLAEDIGVATGHSPVPIGQLPLPADDVRPLDQLLAQALENRADLDALRRHTQSARAAARLSKSQRVPNLRLGAFLENEAGTDDIKGIGFALPIPLFNRNQGEIAEAQAEVERLVAEGSAAELAIRREVVEAVATYQAAQRAAVSLQKLVVGTLEENLSLLRQALDAGKIGTSDVLLFRREFVEGQRQFIEALFEAQAAQIALDLATGGTQIPSTGGQETP